MIILSYQIITVPCTNANSNLLVLEVMSHRDMTNMLLQCLTCWWGQNKLLSVRHLPWGLETETWSIQSHPFQPWSQLGGAVGLIRRDMTPTTVGVKLQSQGNPIQISMGYPACPNGSKAGKTANVATSPRYMRQLGIASAKGCTMHVCIQYDWNSYIYISI